MGPGNEPGSYNVCFLNIVLNMTSLNLIFFQNKTFEKVCNNVRALVLMV